MIRSFRHKGLRILYETGSRRGVPAARAERLGEILTLLDVATSPRDLALPGFRLHRLQGKLASAWSLTVSGNWRVTFLFEMGDVLEVDLVDYH
jgi:proteic killer suppression protein